MIDTLPIIIAYVVPSTLIAFVVATVDGYRVAENPRSPVSHLSSPGLYLLFSVPNSFAAGVLFFTLRDADVGRFPSSYEVGAAFTGSNLVWLVLPGLVLMTHLVAEYFRYVRAETREALHEPFVTLARSKGAPPSRVARHVFRKAAVPLVTLFATELIGVLLVTVFVIEVVFQVPGVGLPAYEALRAREIEPLLIPTVLFSLVAFLSNMIQDAAAIAFDARLDS